MCAILLGMCVSLNYHVFSARMPLATQLASVYLCVRVQLTLDRVLVIWPVCHLLLACVPLFGHLARVPLFAYLVRVPLTFGPCATLSLGLLQWIANNFHCLDSA